MKLKDRLKWHKKKLLEQIDQERERQIEKWGIQERSISSWNGVLLEEILEFTQGINDYNDNRGDLSSARDELIQSITVGLNVLDMLNKELDK